MPTVCTVRSGRSVNADTGKGTPVPTRVHQLQATVSGLLRRLVELASPRGRAADGDGPRRALAVMDKGPNRAALEAVFRNAKWSLVITDSTASAMAQHKTDPMPIIFYEREAEPDWREAVALLSSLSPPPYVILLSRQYDKNLWDETARCGGSDILRAPLEPDSVVRAVQSGWSIWRSEQILRHGTKVRS